MKKSGYLSLLFIICTLFNYGQKVQTMVPRQPVIIGTAFQVQYIISNPSEFITANIPDFDSLKKVSGPNYYKGEASIDGKLESIGNITYTLVPTRTGTIKIPGISAEYKNKSIQKSDDAYISVIQAPDVSYNTRSSYTDAELYRPHSKKDLQQIIDNNLFIKAETTKRKVYAGEPLVVTFTLYSRLQSSSEAIKSPGLYGFSMIDMLKINKAHQSVKSINGKIFNTSVLRKVQLYPVQPGKLEIDPMYVHNEIEFIDSVNKSKKFIVEKELASEAISIWVKDLPLKHPDSYTGAVGSFSIIAQLSKDSIPLNEQGKLDIIIKGKGNFIQFGQPIISFNPKITFSDPRIIEHLNNELSPVEGSRNYEFLFSVDSIGTYALPPVAFSYFDMATKNFKTISTDPINFIVIPKSDNKRSLTANRYVSNIHFWWWSILISVASLLLLFHFLSKKEKAQKKPIISNFNPLIHQLKQINPEKNSIKECCLEIQKTLADILREKNKSLGEKQKSELKELITLCQLAIYSGTDIININEIKERAIIIASQL